VSGRQRLKPLRPTLRILLAPQLLAISNQRPEHVAVTRVLFERLFKNFDRKRRITEIMRRNRIYEHIPRPFWRQPSRSLKMC